MIVPGSSNVVSDGGREGSDGDSAVGAEDGAGFDGSSAGRTWGCGGRGLVGKGCGGADLAGDICGLHGVESADATGHEEGFDEAEEGRDSRPEEEEVEDSEAGVAEVEVVYPEGSEKDGQKDADDLVAVGVLELGVEPGSLVIVHAVGVDRIDKGHGQAPGAV